jgi:hypothetical protein
MSNMKRQEATIASLDVLSESMYSSYPQVCVRFPSNPHYSYMLVLQIILLVRIVWSSRAFELYVR